MFFLFPGSSRRLIHLKLDQIMSAISKFAKSQQDYNTRQAAAIDGIVSDIKALNAKIAELQNSPGQITPEDQAALDDLEKKGADLTQKLEDLDSQQPPAVPEG